MGKKTAKSVGTSQVSQTNNQKAGQDDGGGSAIDLLKADHRKVEELFKKFEQLDDSAQKREIVHQICQELIVHAMLEEEIFYPACREKAGSEEASGDALDEAQVEHDTAKAL